jgi:class 3 adenylate cyclase
VISRQDEPSYFIPTSNPTSVGAMSEMRTLAASLAADVVGFSRLIEFRIGIHIGDVVDESVGDGVNIAARLEGIAQPGAICLSEDVYRQVRGRLDLAVSDLGETQLENIPDWSGTDHARKTRTILATASAEAGRLRVNF